jgi:hypothetical protein
MSFQPSFQPDGMRPGAISTFSGPGLPGGHVSHGSQGQSAGGILSGIGIPDTNYRVFDTDGHSSSIDPVSNPRAVINTQYFFDSDTMNFDNDVGDMEVHFMDVESGPPGMVGPNKPHRFFSLSRVNHWLKQPAQQLAFGEEKDPHWWNQRFSFVGILRHDNSKGRAHAEAGNVCQLFTTGFRTRCIDIWQACEGLSLGSRHAIGPENGDLLQLVLRKYEEVNELDRAFGVANPKISKYWQWAPYYSKDNQEASPVYYTNYTDGTMGKVEIVGRVACVYGAPTNAGGARAAARNAVWHVTSDASYRPNLLKLRQLDIDVGAV